MMINKVSEVEQSAPRARHGHGWMMIGCGVMLAVVLVLVATGAVRATVFIGAAACIAMMAAMMLMMSRSMGGHDHHDNDDR